MEQIMNYVDGQIDYSKRLRYLLVQIIEALPEVNELDIQYSIRSDLQFSSWFEFYQKKGLFMVGLELSDGDLIKNDNLFELTLLVKELYKYFKMFNIPENELFIAKWVFVALHELGHICNFYMNRYIYPKIEKVNQAHRKGIQKIIDKSDPISSMIAYFNSASELQADQYAYRYFPYIWNMLKQRGLI